MSIITWCQPVRATLSLHDIVCFSFFWIFSRTVLCIQAEMFFLSRSYDAQFFAWHWWEPGLDRRIMALLWCWLVDFSLCRACVILTLLFLTNLVCYHGIKLKCNISPSACFIYKFYSIYKPNWSKIVNRIQSRIFKNKTRRTQKPTKRHFMLIYKL